jgi:hypothetical protein
MELKKKQRYGDIVKKEFVEEIWREVLNQREEILKAFIAETGLYPSECEQVEQRNPDGTITWFVRKRKE